LIREYDPELDGVLYRAMMRVGGRTWIIGADANRYEDQARRSIQIDQIGRKDLADREYWVEHLTATDLEKFLGGPAMVPWNEGGGHV
jgi:hypothetical protein